MISCASFISYIRGFTTSFYYLIRWCLVCFILSRSSVTSFSCSSLIYFMSSSSLLFHSFVFVSSIAKSLVSIPSSMTKVYHLTTSNCSSTFLFLYSSCQISDYCLFTSAFSNSFYSMSSSKVSHYESSFLSCLDPFGFLRILSLGTKQSQRGMGLIRLT